MKFLFILMALLLHLKSITYAQNCNSSTTKILMIGDSWSYFPWTYNSLENNLSKYGFSDIKTYSNTVLSVNGKKVRHMIDPVYMNEVSQALINNPSINIISISAGGNDFLADWHKTMSQIETDSLLDVIAQDTDSLIRLLTGLNPELQIYLPMYDFPNFGEVVGTYPSPSSHPFYNTWNNMGQPTFIELNTQLLNYHQKIMAVVNTYSHVNFVDPIGLMQNIYGQTYPLPVSPGGMYPADSVLVPGGYLDYPSPKIAMANYGLFYDAFHFSSTAYNHYYDYHVKHYFFNALRANRDTVLNSIESEDGAVSNTTINQSSIVIGNDGTSDLKGILSFNTTGIGNIEEVGKAHLFLKRDSLSNTKPINDKVLLYIATNYFGTNNTLEILDFSDGGNLQDTACIYGDLNTDGSWVRIDIPESFFPFINQNGVTQFKIEAIQGVTGELFFFEGNDSLYMPQLDIYYSSSLVNIDPIFFEEKNTFSAFPNPSEGIFQLNVNNNNYTGIIELIDLNGKISFIKVTHGNLDISKFKKGIYTIRLQDNGKYLATRVVKQ